VPADVVGVPVGNHHGVPVAYLAVIVIALLVLGSLFRSIT
jgi:hypothetical protein